MHSAGARASRDALAHVVQVIECELNSVTDNPLVFDDGDIISGGNFHGQPLALTLDYAAIALSEIASISERRTYLLLEGHDGLPKLLMKDTGINSGFMIPQYTAAALVSEKQGVVSSSQRRFHPDQPGPGRSCFDGIDQRAEVAQHPAQRRACPGG